MMNEDLTIINGSQSVLVIMLEEKYSYTKEIAEDEINRFLWGIALERQPVHG